MAVNEKPVYAETHTTYNGRYYKPGDRMDGRVPEGALEQAKRNGVATDSATRAEAARKLEAERIAHVAEQIAGRSEKKEHNERASGRIKQLYRMPDGSLREVNS